MEAFGARIGRDYERIWDDSERIVQAVAQSATEQANVTLGARPGLLISRPWRIVHWTLFSLGLGSLFAMLGAYSNLSALGGSSAGGGWTTAWLAVTTLWLFSLWPLAEAHKLHTKDAVALRAAFTDVAIHKALAVLDERRAEARSHVQTTDPKHRFHPKGPMPLPQRYGVSHEGAEQLVAEWMRYFGEEDAEVTRFTGDGGIDVQSLHYIAQVKNYSGSVGVAEVRELAGVASADGRKPLFFTSGTYASGSVEFADRVGMALFRYDAIAGSLHDENHQATHIFEQGL